MPNSFTLDVQRFVDRANGNLDLVVRKIALDLFSRVIIKTPVLTGRAKGSWLVSVNSIPQGDPGTLDKSGNVSFQRVNAAVAGMKAGQVISMVSCLAYSNRLEMGYSKQAPAGMVRLSILEYSSVVQTAAASLP